MSILSRRYAQATMDALAGPADLPALQQSLRSFLAVYEDDAQLRAVLHNPVLRPQRRPLLEKLLARLEITDMAAGLLQLLADNDRLPLLPAVLAEMDARRDRDAHTMRAHVQVASALSAAQHKALEAALKARLGHKVVAEVTVQPELLGGLICQVGDVTYDTSLRHQLTRLAERLSSHA